MKNNYLYIKSALVLAIGILFVLPFGNREQRQYTPRSEQERVVKAENGGLDYVARIRSNQTTGTIDVRDVEKAQQQLRVLDSRKEGASKWIFRGPDNIGGRTRALLFDKDNSNVMYAGGVAGGLWKSTTAGQYWVRVEYNGATAEDFANLAIVSITQATNGDIYFGTGEGLYSLSGSGSGGILGAGIWKSSDNGQTFSRLPATWTTEDDKDTYSAVSELAADVSNPDLIYAATLRGLRFTSDGGATWEKAPMPDITYDNIFSSDVLVTGDGTVIASVGNLCLLKKPGASSFVLRSGNDEEDGGTLISNSNIGRLEFASSPQDPNYIYCLASKPRPDDVLRNIYKSEDGGESWFIVGQGGSSLFQPLGNQGVYDMCIAVNPLKKDHVLIGGLDLWEGNAAVTGKIFAWKQISNWQLPYFNPLFIHADLHALKFDPKDPQTLFVGSDGGISRGFLNKDNVKYQFRTMNKNYNVTQYYSVGINSLGNLIGGTQDNGTLLITGFGNTEYNGWPVLGGDGGHVAMSQINPTIAYATIYYGGLWRNNDQDFRDWNSFYTSDLADAQEWSGGVWDPDKRQAAFVTPITYWETDNDTFSDDSVMLIARRDYPADTTVIFPSHNVNKAPIVFPITNEIKTGDTIYYHDPFSALFALGMKRNIWLTRKAANWNNTMAQKDWWRAIKRGTLGSDEYITQMVFSADGDHLFFSTYNENNGQNDIYRLSNLNLARTYNEADYLFGKDIQTELTKIGSSSGRAVTGIAVDPNNIDNLIVCLGNYGNDAYAYLCTDAASIAMNSSMTNFTDITGSLPKIPVYCALFEMDKTAGRVMLGTDLGVFISEDVITKASAGAPIVWTPHQEGVGPAPVFQITQQISKKWSSGNYGRIYIATHGLGLFEDRTYQGISDERPQSSGHISEAMSISIFPNPVVTNAKVSMDLKQSENIELNVINISGKIVQKFQAGFLLKGDNTVDVNLEELKPGVYLIQANGQGIDATTRFIKK